jgi:hypothetical protein
LRRDRLQDDLRCFCRLHHCKLLRRTELRGEEEPWRRVRSWRAVHDRDLRRPVLLGTVHLPSAVHSERAYECRVRLELERLE